MDNNFDNEKNKDGNMSFSNISGDMNDDNIKVDKDIQGSVSQNKQIDEDQTPTNEVKEKDTDKKEGSDKEPIFGEDTVNKDTADNNTVFADFRPPHYVPDFTVYGSGKTNTRADYTFNENEKKPKKEKITLGIGAVAIICTVCILLSATVGAIAGAIAGGGLVFDLSALGRGDKVVNIIRGEDKIVVNEVPGDTGYDDLTVAQVASLVGNSVVEITTTQKKTSGWYGQYVTSGAGSGVVFDQDGTTGYIVTNYHVIDGADTISVRVTTKDGQADYEAYYMAGDDKEDIAVIKITVSSDVELTKAVFVGDSDKLTVGERVVAIGNPLGQLGGTVTDGIISALDREIMVGDNTMVLLQTNAAINPGNSGGGLFNMSGELVGIVNAKQSSTGIEGLGFAIPANRVRENITDILEKGYITGRAELGIEGKYYSTGIYVSDPKNTDFKVNDKIIRIKDTEINSISDYNTVMKKLQIGEKVIVRVIRGNQYVDVTVTVIESTSKY